VTHTNGTFAAVGETSTVEFLRALPGIEFLDSGGAKSNLATTGQKYTGTITIVTPEPTTGGVLLCADVGVVL